MNRVQHCKTRGQVISRDARPRSSVKRHKYSPKTAPTCKMIHTSLGANVLTTRTTTHSAHPQMTETEIPKPSLATGPLSQGMLVDEGPISANTLHATFQARFPGTAEALPPPKTAPNQRKPLGGKPGHLVGIGGQISRPRQKPPPWAWAGREHQWSLAWNFAWSGHFPMVSVIAMLHAPLHDSAPRAWWEAMFLAIFGLWVLANIPLPMVPICEEDNC